MVILLHYACSAVGAVSASWPSFSKIISLSEGYLPVLLVTYFSLSLQWVFGGRCQPAFSSFPKSWISRDRRVACGYAGSYREVDGCPKYFWQCVKFISILGSKNICERTSTHSHTKHFRGSQAFNKLEAYYFDFSFLSCLHWSKIKIR